MSLVNDMLRDLDKRGQRRQTSLEETAIQPVYEHSYEPRKHKFSWLLWGAVCVLCIGFSVLAWLQLSSFHSQGGGDVGFAEALGAAHSGRE